MRLFGSPSVGALALDELALFLQTLQAMCLKATLRNSQRYPAYIHSQTIGVWTAQPSKAAPII